MKKLFLILSAVILTLGIANESRAECAVGSIACGDDCAADDGKSTCHWEIDSNGKLSITGSGAMKDYKVVNSILEYIPWRNYLGKYSTADIKGINHIGNFAFYQSELKSVSFDDSVTSIGGSSFSQNNISSLSLPDSIENIKQWAFADNKLTSVVLPDSLKSLGDAVFNYNQLSEVVIPDTVGNAILRSFGTNLETLENLRIECKGSKDSCQKINKLLRKYGYEFINGDFVYIDLSHRLFGIGQENCDSTNFYWNGKECLREPDVTKRTCCADVCKDMGGWCNRIRYTPAEAAQVLKDDNTNEVTITFKK